MNTTMNFNGRTWLWAIALVAVLAFMAAPVPVQAQEAEAAEAEEAASERTGEEEADEDLTSFFAQTTVTATGSEADSFDIATPVTVLTAEDIEYQAPNNATDLLRAQPGVDVNGVGFNQPRPIIRGQRGLRVLFLENGLRMNNARRQSDFGEITGLTDVAWVQTMEVVRGPASVLYGSDAIGGVLNLVTRTPAYRGTSNVGGGVGLHYGTAGDMGKATAGVDGRFEKTYFGLGGAYRDASDYNAPAGTFGDIEFDEKVPVNDTGIKDTSFYGLLGYQIADSHEIFLRGSIYRADETGFGYVDPEILGEDTLVRIFYPYQDFDRYTLGYLGSALGSVMADAVDVQAYYQRNKRELSNHIDVNFGPLAPGWPNSGLVIDTLNFTDLDTLGLRGEVVKLAGDRNLLTYGLEYFTDDSFNTDESLQVTSLRFPFPPFELNLEDTDDIANTPNAENTSWGLFIQDEINVHAKVKIVAGLRYQDVSTKSKATPGWEITGLDFSDDAVVGALNVVYSATDFLNVFGSYGTAFRAPNIVERLFTGTTPEGSGYQILNPDLISETSENFDLGVKYRRRSAYFELILFRNEIKDGIVQDFLSDEEIAQLPPPIRDEIEQLAPDFVVQQANLDKLRYEGVEFGIGWRGASGFSVGGNYTYLDGERLDQDNPPIAGTLTTKINGWARYDARTGRYWAEYRFRHNGAANLNVDPDQPRDPVGDEVPAFTIHTLSGGVNLFRNARQSHDLVLIIDNLSNELYSEVSNASFFRPQPERSFIANYRLKL